MSQSSTRDHTIENVSVLAYAVMEQMHGSLLRPMPADDVCMGLLMGLAMFMDDKIGPQQMALLMRETPSIILRTDAHVPADRLEHFAPFLRAFGQQLAQVEAEGALT